MRDWMWVDGDASDCSTNALDVEENNCESSSYVEPDSASDATGSYVPAITHSVIFKCIGHLKECRYQGVLELASKKIMMEKICQ